MSVIRANMELANLSVVKSILIVDSESMTTDKSGFVNDNALGAYVLVNTWLLIIQQYSKYGYLRILDMMVKEGLIATIRQFDEAATKIVRGELIDNASVNSIIQDVYSNFRITGIPKSVKEINSDPVATALFVCRYPKRFSPVKADLVTEASISDFIATENRTKLLQRRDYEGSYAFNYVKAEMAAILDWDSLCIRVSRVVSDKHDFIFTSGVGFDSGRTLLSKLSVMAKEYPEFFYEPFGIPYTGAFPHETNKEYWANDEEIRPVRVMAVPKSYKAARIVAPEGTVRQAKARAIMREIDAFLPCATPIHDQSVNQVLARYGSLTHGLATVDLSHASDCISKSLFWSLFPRRFAQLVYPYLGTHTVIDGKRRVMQQMSTAGNSLTFALESLVFLAIARAAVRICERFGSTSEEYVRIGDRNYPVPSVYGDDIILPSACYETLVSILEALGFIVNEAKSFSGDSPFRESCGSEWYDGVDVSSYYFPRFPILGKLGKDAQVSLHAFRDSRTDEIFDSLSSLVSLQHRLFGVCYPASRFIFEIVRESHPKMTTSQAGTEADDCWDYYEQYQLVLAPMSKESRDLFATTLRQSPSKLPDWVRRRSIYSMRVTYADPKPEDLIKRYALESGIVLRCLEVFRYQTFLQNGPKYSDPLLKTLGISDEPVSLAQAFSEPTITWGMRRSSEF